MLWWSGFSLVLYCKLDVVLLWCGWLLFIDFLRVT